MLVRKRRISLGIDSADWLADAMALPRVQLLPLTPVIAIAAGNFGDVLHGDPADRIIVATAQHHRATLITRDERITRAAIVPILW